MALLVKRMGCFGGYRLRYGVSGQQHCLINILGTYVLRTVRERDEIKCIDVHMPFPLNRKTVRGEPCCILRSTSCSLNFQETRA
jgi:hypothetical protein